MHREEHLDLCAARVLGSIDEADRLELERHLAQGCAECERALVELGEGAALLAASVAPVAPPPRVRAAVLEAVRQEASAAPARPARTIQLPERRQPAWPTWAMAAAAGLLAVVTLVTWRTAETLRAELQTTRERLAQAEQDLATERAWAAVATSPGARVVDLAPLTGGVTLPLVRATYDPASRRAIVVFDRLAPPSGSDFELWAILPDGPLSLGVVRPDASGRAEVRVPDAGDPAALAAFAISLEPAGGSPDPRKPSGPVVLAGSIKG